MSRTAGDQWDIVSSVGFTALMVSTLRALETARPAPLIRDEFARHFVQAAGEPRLTAVLNEAKPDSEWDSLTHHAVDHLSVRTMYFDEFFSAATASGVRQVVILAAGLDSRAYRLPWPDGTVLYELDQPKVLEFKARVLADQDARPLTDRREVAADLRDDWVSALTAQGFDSATPTTWLLEGLLPYLPSAAQDALFETITGLSAPGSSLATEWRVRQTSPGQWREAIAKITPEFLRGIDFTALTYEDERSDPVEWLREHGWQVDTTPRLQQAALYGRAEPTGLPVPSPLWANAFFVTATRKAPSA
jgi:methyltransferase (TIGR00027 family)